MLSLEKEAIYCPYCGQRVKKIADDRGERFYCPVCGSTIYKNPVPVVVIVVFNSKGEILLIKRKVEPEKGEWALPSGFIELSEEPAYAAKRELLEETGIELDDPILINVYHQRSKRYESIVVIVYMGFSDSTPKPGDDAEDAGFFSLKTLPKIPFESHTRAIREAVALRKK
ncbi:MAG TPA: NUDIX hydrolase [Candidatus Hydrothermia bacterium]|jgi:ADP-ribose pyrophosphatase YjhB (NUDIX family)|nr:NUDIX hydrolase [Candidatus Hydrothermae bacterium]MDD3649660.1 NUDIX hydrolase [Candidatus Hydrothermia bacterium]MDD5572978.1 NUDIX hydrolase [Candidatus Hydrothermia bacterium]HOK23570.1 NUDIX hydrolase [Candidatus Hydrothermia bacterium]HOL24281.1 NUDIX hydrolase [Candidatus Hydrothermia bacterium]